LPAVDPKSCLALGDRSMKTRRRMFILVERDTVDDGNGRHFAFKPSLLPAR